MKPEEIAHRVNAFDALLFLAKEADANDTTNYLLRHAIKALDAQHPGWREWA